MKNTFTQILFFLISLFIFSSIHAQSFPYTLEVESNIYTDLENDIELTSVGDNWDDPEFVIPIGFNFDFYGETYSYLYTSDGTGGSLSFEDPNFADDPLVFLVPYLDDIVDIEGVSASQSTISYKTEGTAGEQILKIQWNDCGFYQEMLNSGTANNRVSFQLWLFEGSNNIEFRFGPSTLPDASSIHEFGAPAIGIMEFLPLGNPNEVSFWHLSGDPTAPTIFQSHDAELNTYSLAGLDSDPAEGQIYRLVNTPTSIKAPTQNLELTVYPTIVDDDFFVEISEELLNEKTQITVVNNLGQVIYNNTVTSVKEQFDASHFAPGIYYLRVHNEDGIGTKKFIKK